MRECLLWRLLPAVLTVLLGWPCALSAAGLELRQIKNASGQPIAFEVAGLTKEETKALSKLAVDDAAWQRMLAVYVAGEGARGDVPSMLGTYTVGDATVRFTPKYPLKAGMRYRVMLQPAAVIDPQATEFPGDRVVTVYITVPSATRGEPTKVVAVYPSAATLPENQLRFYLHFSAPMSRGEVYQRVKLLDERGKPVAFPFLEIGEELWDSGATRVTLLIDPGRIKRGLKPREDLGPVLEAGKKYRIVIDKRWKDAAGQSLAANFEKAFAAGPPIEKALDTADWKIESPAAGSQKPLAVRFPAPLDRALMERMISVQGADGKPIAGDVTIADEEKTWRFTPDQPWRAGKHELVIDGNLEDVVGNRIGEAFEVDQTGPIENKIKTDIHRVPFIVGAAK